VKDGTYSLSGQYNMGVPEIEASKYQFELHLHLRLKKRIQKLRKLLQLKHQPLKRKRREMK